MAERWRLLKLIRAPNVIVKQIRVSTLARYYWCAVQSYLMSLGHQPPRREAMSRGTRIHKEIEVARKDSRWEAEFLEKLEQFWEDRDGERVLARPWKDIEVYGEFLTHGIDEFQVYPNRTVQVNEYKTKTSRWIRPVDTAPAIFQNKVYAWILEPILAIMNYRLVPGLVIFIDEKGQPLGETDEIRYDFFSVEADIERILYQYNNPDELIPPQRWKCNICAEVFKSRCPFQR